MNRGIKDTEQNLQRQMLGTEIKLRSALNVIDHIPLSFAGWRLEPRACDRIVLSGQNHQWLPSRRGKDRTR